MLFVFIIFLRLVSTNGDTKCSGGKQPPHDSCTPDFDWGSDYCTLDPKLQLVYIVQCSSKHIIGKFKEVSEITKDLQKRYPGSTFAVTKFSDYPYPNAHNNSEGCYLRHQHFTEDPDTIKMASKTIEILISGNIESSGSALLYSAVDQVIGWRNDQESQRVVVLITDDYSQVGERPRNRPSTKPPRVNSKGDGTDTCSKNLSPKFDFVGEKLRNLNVSVFGILTHKFRHDLSTYWKRIADHDMRIPYASVNMDKNNNANILKALIAFIDSLDRGFVSCMDPPAYNTLGY